MTFIMDIRHWLDGDDIPAGPPRLRRNALRIVRFIEYGGPLERLHGRETLIQCKRRPTRKPCPTGCRSWSRTTAGIRVHCPVCHD